MIRSTVIFVALVGFGCGFLGGDGAQTSGVDGTTASEEGSLPPGVYKDEPVQSDQDRFYAAGYRYCDAKLLAGYWDGKDVWEAKGFGGQKVARGDRDVLDEVLEIARDQAREKGLRCDWREGEYSFEDMEAVAAHWGYSVSEAKTWVEGKLAWGNYAAVDEVLGRGGAGGEEGEGPEHGVGGEDEAWRAFLTSEVVDYCHAKMLAGHWDITVDQAKVTLGYKIAGGYTEQLDTALNDARRFVRDHPQSRCSYGDTRFSYDDAALIAGAWKQGVAEVKATIVDKYMWGSEGNIREELVRLRGAATAGATDAAADDAFFASEDVDFCHAKMLAAAWSVSVGQAKTSIGHKLLAGAEDLLASALDQARTYAQGNTEARCAFYETSFTPADAQVVAEAWSISLSEAKTTIADKYLYGLEANIHSLLGSRRSAERAAIDEEAALRQFYAYPSPDYCHAKMLSAAWSVPIHEAKILLGHKMVMGWDNAVFSAMGEGAAHARANRGDRCEYGDTRFSYEDAVKLAKVWSLSESQAKARVLTKYLSLDDGGIDSLLKK